MNQREMQTVLAPAASYVHSAQHNVRRDLVSMGRVARAAVAVGLALVVAGCGSASPAATGAPAVGTPTAPASSAPAASSLVTSVTPTASSPATSPATAPTPAPFVVAATAPGPALKQLWQIGGPKPPKDGGCCPTVAPDGNLWVSSEYDASFWIIGPNGKYLGSWGAPGTGNGQFNFAGTGGAYGDITFDPDGTFYVADTGNHRVQEFDTNRHFVKAWGSFGTDDGQFANPAWVVSDGQGHIYVADTDRRDVQEFNSDGAYVRTVTSDTNVFFMAADSKGHVYVGDGPTILVYDADGHQLPGFDLSSTGAYVGGMAIDAAGHLFIPTISSYDSPITTEPIYELDGSGKVLHAWPGDADSIALDPKGGALYTSFFSEPFIRKLELPKP